MWEGIYKWKYEQVKKSTDWPTGFYYVHCVKKKLFIEDVRYFFKKSTRHVTFLWRLTFWTKQNLYITVYCFNIAFLSSKERSRKSEKSKWEKKKINCSTMWNLMMKLRRLSRLKMSNNFDSIDIGQTFFVSSSRNHNAFYLNSNKCRESSCK